MRIEFTQGNKYQELLVEYSQKLESAAERLSENIKKTLLKEAEIILKAKSGINIVIDGETRLVKASNEDERKQLVNYLLGDLAIEKAVLEHEVSVYESLSKNMRQNLSAEQTKMKARDNGREVD